MNSTSIKRERVGAGKKVLLLTIDRADRANAYTDAMLRELLQIVDEAATDRSIAAGVITGAGSSFCGGADLASLESRKEDDALFLLSRTVFDRWAEMPFPTVAAVNGPAVGGGFELALASDVRICAPRAFFQLPETAMGLLPAAGGMRRLLAELGASRTKELVLFRRTLDAAAAASWGLVSAVAEDPVARALVLAESVTTQDSLCSAVAKMLIQDWLDMTRGRGAEAVGQALLYGRRSRSRTT